MAVAAAVKHTILVLEDDDDALLALSEVLEMAGYDVLAASHAREALLHIAGGPLPNAIIVDAKAPGTDSWNFVEHRRHDCALSAIPMIVVSGESLPDGAITESLTFLAKPLRLGTLFSCLTAVGV